MKTTELFIDILIIGFFSLIWICCFVFAFLISPVQAKSFLLHSPEVAILLIFIISYSLGILFDYINSGIFWLFKSKEERELYKNMSITKVLAKNEKIDDLIEMYYGRLRILRGLIASLPLIIVSLSLFILKENIDGLKLTKCSTIWAVILSGTVLFTISIL